MTAVTNAESLPKVAKRKQTKTGIAGFLLFFTDKHKHKQNKREHSHFHHALYSLPSVFRNTMKKKNKLLLCFRPLTDEDRIVTHPRDSNLLLPSKDKSTEISKFKSDQEALRITRRRSRSLNASSRNFCSDLKSVLVEASMQQQKQTHSEANAARPILRSKSHHDSINSRKSLARVGTVQDSSVQILSSSISETEHRTSMPFSQIDSLPKSQFHADAKSKSSNSGLVIFAMSLCATIFCGRICAILFTLIFFYCMPRRTIVDSRLKSVLKLPEETEKEYKKRVIIEGLLERNHHLCRGKLLRRKEVIRLMYDKLKQHHSVAIHICFRVDGY